MLSTPYSAVAIQHRELAGCVEDLYRICAQPNRPSCPAWRRHLESLVLVYGVDEFLGLGGRSVKVEQTHQALNLIPQLEHARLSLLAGALWHACRHAEGFPGPDFELQLGAVEHTRSHITYAVHGEVRLILLPTILGDDDCAMVADELATLVARNPGERWVIDLSAVSMLPQLMLANLMWIGGRLRAHGGNIFLCWVREALFEEFDFERVCTFFDLISIGGTLFTKSTRPTEPSSPPVHDTGGTPRLNR